MIAAVRPIGETSFAIRQDARTDDDLQPVLGIDPGLSGAWAALWPSGAIAAGISQRQGMRLPPRIRSAGPLLEPVRRYR